MNHVAPADPAAAVVAADLSVVGLVDLVALTAVVVADVVAIAVETVVAIAVAVLADATSLSWDTRPLRRITRCEASEFCLIAGPPEGPRFSFLPKALVENSRATDGHPQRAARGIYPEVRYFPL